MKKSEQLLLGCLATGTIAGGFIYYETGWIWVSVIVGLLVCGGLYQGFLDMLSKESIINSKTINRK